MFRQLSRSIRFQFQKMSTQTSPQPPKVPLGPYLKTRQPKWYDKYTVREKQIFARILYASTLGGIVIVKFASHHEKIQDFIKGQLQHTIEGDPTIMKQRVKMLITEVLNELNWSQEEQPLLKSFIGNVYEIPKIWGSKPPPQDPKPQHLLLLLPQYFNYDSEDEVPLDQMNLVLPDSKSDKSEMTKTLSQHEYNPHLRKLKESFSLSEKAIKFSIAREIKRAESFSLGIHVLMSFFLVTTYHVIVKTINRHLGLHPLPLKFRMANYFVFGFCHLLIYFSMKSKYDVMFELRLDDEVARISSDFADGGIEYYEKEQQRHLAYRALLPKKKGEKKYNRNGDIIPYLIFSRGLSANDRIKKCKDIRNLHDAGLQ